MNIPGILSVLGTLEQLVIPLPRVLGTHLVPPLDLCTCESLSLEWHFPISSQSPVLTFYELCSNVTPPSPVYLRIAFPPITCHCLNLSLSCTFEHLLLSEIVLSLCLFVVDFNKFYEFKDLVNFAHFCFLASRRVLCA